MSVSANVVGRALAMFAGMEGAQFASFTYRAKESGELAKHTVILNFSTRNVYEKDVAVVEAILANPDTDELTRIAAGELLSSLAVSLSGGIGNNPAYTHSADARGEGNETYTTLFQGVKVHNITGEIYVYGLAESKTVLEAGTYKVVKSAPKTLAKKAIQKTLRSGKIRQFALGNVQSVRMNGDTLELI